MEAAASPVVPETHQQGVVDKEPQVEAPPEPIFDDKTLEEVMRARDKRAVKIRRKNKDSIPPQKSTIALPFTQQERIGDQDFPKTDPQPETIFDEDTLEEVMRARDKRDIKIRRNNKDEVQPQKSTIAAAATAPLKLQQPEVAKSFSNAQQSTPNSTFRGNRSDDLILKAQGSTPAATPGQQPLKPTSEGSKSEGDLKRLSKQWSSDGADGTENQVAPSSGDLDRGDDLILEAQGLQNKTEGQPKLEVLHSTNASEFYSLPQLQEMTCISLSTSKRRFFSCTPWLWPSISACRE